MSDPPDRFCDCFCDKIKCIREDLDLRSCNPPTFAVFEEPLLSQFEPVSEKVIHELIIKSPKKFCMLDPIPASLAKQCLNDLVSLIIMVMVSASLSAGILYSPLAVQAGSCNTALEQLKKPGLDSNDMNNFRPVSNLPFISKILEKVVLIQLRNYLCSNNLLEICQSAYRKDYSTETAGLSVLDGLLISADERLVCLVAVLDLSAAFDSLDHKILLQWLEMTYGVRGKAQKVL